MRWREYKRIIIYGEIMSTSNIGALGLSALIAEAAFYMSTPSRFSRAE